jgi:rhamnogalacturonyl hydrolase YesR
LVADHIEANGEEVEEVWSYTQGAMIGAATLLYQATGNSGYLNDAYAGAKATMAYFSLGALVSEGEAAPAFASILVRNLLYLGYVMRNNLGHQLAQEYVNFAWETLRQSNGLYLTPEGSATSLLGQAGIVQIYSLLSTSPATYF